MIIYKSKNELKILSKINLNNSFTVNNQSYSNINLSNKKDVYKILVDLKNTYEDEWKKNNEINTSIKLPLTISVKSNDYKMIIKLEEVLANMDLISHFHMLKFDNNNTQYRVTYNGSPKTFFNDMSDKKIHLMMENNVWIIK